MAGTPGTPTCSARLWTDWSVRILRLDGTQSGRITPERLTGVPANQASRDNIDEREFAARASPQRTAVHVARNARCGRPLLAGSSVQNATPRDRPFGAIGQY